MKLESIALVLMCIGLVYADDTTVPEGSGVLLLGVEAGFNDADTMHARGVWIKNVETGKSYGSSSDALQMIVVPEGIYCVDEIELWPRGMGSINYCGEPYIKVKKNVFNNAGLWQFQVDLDTSRVKLVDSLKKPEEALERAKKKYPEYF